jgi:hypothetical protein
MATHSGILKFIDPVIDWPIKRPPRAGVFYSRLYKVCFGATFTCCKNNSTLENNPDLRPNPPTSCLREGNPKDASHK